MAGEDTNLDAARVEAEARIGRHVGDRELASYQMYPQVFTEFAAHRRIYGDISQVPTKVYFYGMELGEETAIDMERGKSLVIRLLAVGDVRDDGARTVFFELNGQPRSIRIEDFSLASTRPVNRVADDANPNHVGAPMPGLITGVVVQPGQKVLRGERLLSIEAMKMETGINAERDGVIAEVIAAVDTQIRAKDLLIVFEE